jgi:hypothetical protein
MKSYDAPPYESETLQSFNLPNFGIIQCKLNDDFVKYLWEIIDIAKQNGVPNPYEGGNENLKGLPVSLKLHDKDNYFLKILPDYVTKYKDSFGETFWTDNEGKVETEFRLNDVWVNFQKENQFNAAHTHAGIYSFVIWLKCPAPSTFQFTYPTTIGGLNHLSYSTDSSYENMMVFFPAQLLHQVYPFYESDEVRVSVAGNIGVFKK